MTYRNEYQRVQDDVYWTLPRLLVGLFIVILGFSVLGLGACAVGLIGGAATNAATVVQKEFYPDALLKKYEWFKDAAAALDKKQADMKVYDARLTALSDAYRDTPRSQWPRDDREQSAIWQSELAGIKASYNSLAADYNSQMAKFNWRFTNVGDVPAGGSPLPREFRTYEAQ